MVVGASRCGLWLLGEPKTLAITPAAATNAATAVMVKVVRRAALARFSVAQAHEHPRWTEGEYRSFRRTVLCMVTILEFSSEVRSLLCGASPSRVQIGSLTVPVEICRIAASPRRSSPVEP